jgi:molybdopterin-binding protein
VSFSVVDGDYCVLLGPSGAGKSVILEIIAGLIQPDSGRIYRDDIDITTVPIRKRRIGLVFQGRALFPHLTIRHNISYGLRCIPCSHAERGKRVDMLSDALSISHLLDRMPGSLSGGEAQRVALARALAPEPRCLLLDEPLSSLDADVKADIRALLRRLHRMGHTIIHVTHDYEEAISLATQVGIIDNGTISQVGTPRDVFHNPSSAFAAKFLGIRNFFTGELCHTGGDATHSAQFTTNGLTFAVLTDEPDSTGAIMFPGEAVTLSLTRQETSALNTFMGTVKDIAPIRSGIEITVDIGTAVTAVISTESVERLNLVCGSTVWISFKASAIRFIRG